MKEKKQQMVVSLNYYAGCFLVFCQDDRNSPPTVNSQSFIRNSEHEKKRLHSEREKTSARCRLRCLLFADLSHRTIYHLSRARLGREVFKKMAI